MAMHTGDDRLDVELTPDASDVLATAASNRAQWDTQHAPIGYGPEDLAAVEKAAREDGPSSLTLFECQRAADALHWYAGELTRHDPNHPDLDTALDLASALRRFAQASDNLF